jgi:ribosomal protein S18 acetylase RimI-like enzyme
MGDAPFRWREDKTWIWRGELADKEVLTYLQMLSPDDLRPALRPLVVLEVQELEHDSPLVRDTTLSVGRAHQWPSLSWDDQQWQTYLRREHLRHWVARIKGLPAGLLTLHVPPSGDVEVDTFGLLPEHIGQGIGGHFLTVGVRLAWTITPQVSRVWLHTSSRDHSHALTNYEGRGFRRCELEAP